MTDEDQTIIFSLNGDNRLPERLGSYNDFANNDFADTGDRPPDFAPNLVSLAFIKAAVRRTARFWCATAVIGLFIGLGLYVTSSHPYQASTSLLLTLGPYESAQTAASDNQAIAESRAVAALAVRKLGLQQSASSFLTTYTVTPATDRVLDITVKAPLGDQALLRAGAVASAFLQFRADELRATQALVLQSLNQQIDQARQNVSSLDGRISQLLGQPTSPKQQSQLSQLRSERSQATTTLTNLGQAVTGDQTNIQPATTTAINGSVVLDAPALLAHSRLKPLVLYTAIGFIAGLALALGIVIIRALTSDRLRQRDDIAYALGGPVKLSVGTVRLSRWLPRRHGLAAARQPDVQRITVHLGRAVPGKTWGTPALSVVPVDDLQVPALCLIALAVSCAEEGKQVVVADLCSGAPAARLLGVKDPGVHQVSVHNANLLVAVPERGDIVPGGPLGRRPEQARSSSFTAAVAAACASADLLLTLITLDPALGSEHLSTWATDAVALVTAGRSSATKITATGEMIRLSGTRLASVVLVGADKIDESLGMLEMLRSDAQAGVIERSPHSSAKNSIVAIDEVRGTQHPATVDPGNP